MEGLALGFNGPDGIEFDLSKLGGMPGSGGMDFMGISSDGAVIDLSKLLGEPGSGGKGGSFDFAAAEMGSALELANEINKLLAEMGAEPISLEEGIKLLPWMAANQHKEWTLLIDFLLQEAAALITEARKAMADGE